MPRYTSAFAGRTKRSSSSAQRNQTGESAGSSARNSGSEQAGSGTRSDEDEIHDFVKLLESKEVKAATAKLTKASERPHSVDLSKYSALREPSAQLADDMSASSLLNQGSTPPSRRLSNVPALSTSSSPRPTHVPHVRSRPSTQSIAEEASHPPEDDGSDEEPLLFATEGV